MQEKIVDNIRKRIDLYVPFAQKDEAKALGAKWDATKKVWYIQDKEEIKSFQKWMIRKSLNLINENRTFGGNYLYVDLIPASCWFTNVRYCVSRHDWDNIRTMIYDRVNKKCEVCGESQGRHDAHERWEYEILTATQRLRRLICLCQNCHEATHMGLAQSRGRGEIAKTHLATTNKWTSEDVELHIEEAFEVWSKRNAIKWKLDISILKNAGVTIIKPVKENERQIIAYEKFKSEKQLQKE